MFEDQTVELLPARTVMTVFTGHPNHGHKKNNGNHVRVDVDQDARNNQANHNHVNANGPGDDTVIVNSGNIADVNTHG